ncbi:hypothetical protein BLA29_001885, partial [Euroglyphus maynei]
MVISLDNEISSYEPFGRSIIQSIPNTNIISRRSTDNLDDENFSFNNDFTTAELDQCRDLFRSVNEAENDSSSKLPATNITSDFWRIRKTVKGEEEIYVHSNSLILSHQSQNNNGQSFLDKSLTLQHNIIDAIWCDFTITDEHNLAISSNNDRKSMKILKTLCILDDHYCLHILCDNGDYYQKNLPFRVGKMVATLDHGLLFERIIGSESQEMPNFPAIYTLSNPLNDLSPVLMVMSKSSSSTTTTTTKQLKLINIIAEKNLAIFYCYRNNCHQIFQLRSMKNTDIHQLFLHHYSNVSNNQKSMDSHIMVTPENPSKRQQQQQFTITSSISRSLSNNLIQQIVQQQGSSSGGLLHAHHHRNSSSPLSTTTTTAQYHSPLRHSSSSSSSQMHHHHHHHMDVIASDIPSPCLLMSNLISSRMDSPISPNPLNHTANPRLTDMDIEMYLDSSRNTTMMIDSPNLSRIFQQNSPLNMTNLSLAQSSPSSSMLVNMNGTTPFANRTIDRSSARFFPNEPSFELAMEFV